MRFVALLLKGSCRLTFSDWHIFEKIVKKQDYEDYLRKVIALEIVKK